MLCNVCACKRVSVLCKRQLATCSAVQVCTAACACIQSLSGSMKCLRELPLAQLTPSAVRLLSHTQPEVHLTALKALTNLLLDADTVKVILTSCSPAAGLPFSLLSGSSAVPCSCCLATHYLFTRPAQTSLSETGACMICSSSQA